MIKVNIVSLVDRSLASFRLRQLKIAEFINDSSNTNNISCEITKHPIEKADIYVFFKHVGQDIITTWIDQIRKFQPNAKIIFDISDFHLDSHFGKFYIETANKVDFVTVASKALKEVFSQVTKTPIDIVYEPYQVTSGVEKQRGKYVWLGNQSNIKELTKLLDVDDKYLEDLTVITNKPFPNIDERIKFIEWTEESINLLKGFEFCLIPQTNPYKSPNRFVDSYLAGCKILDFGAKCYEDVRNNLSTLEKQFSLQTIGNQWIDIFNHVFNLKEKEPVLSGLLKDKKFVKLNLGCGRKIYPKNEGWINIDSVRTDGIDVVCDIRNVCNLFGRETCDEVHAYHVVEHFFPQEIVQVLNDWYYVLKSGGKIILETPDFVKAAKNILQIETTDNKDVWYNLGLKAFYGDFDNNNPNVMLDLHKTLYTFKTLSEVVKKAGFILCEEQKPVTHKAERDFRLVAYKP